MNQEEYQDISVEVDPQAKVQIRQERIKQIEEDLTNKFAFEFQKLTEQSVKYKQVMVDAKTGVKNSYYEKKLHKNNEKILALLEEFQTTQNAINKMKGEDNVESPTS